MRAKVKFIWKEYRSLFLLIVLMMVFRSSLADWNEVPTGSMLPTIVQGDRIYVDKIAYDLHVPFTHISLARFGDPKRGDIIVFDSEYSDIRLVKRVVGEPGDSVQMRNKQLYINGQAIEYSGSKAIDNQSRLFVDMQEDLLGVEHAIRVLPLPTSRDNFDSINIPQGYYFALGDNRDNSADSRVIGLIPRDEIIGRARKVVMSLNYDNYYIPRKKRFWQNL